ncbi:MAG: hypothetical protein JW798_05930, partial [Prolixibacteraceae bacterium]|nr:hypothetical protein [Prolixibacteraceae bacterium]
MYTALKYYTTISVFLFILLILYSTKTNAQEYNRQTDSLALVSLYNAANGSSWNNKTGWLAPGVPINQWYGVTVSGNRVTQINLSNNNLSGSIPAKIADLSNLTSLNISANQLQTDLPSLTRLALLNSFNCSNNYLNFGNLHSSGVFSSFMIYRPQKTTFALSSVPSGNTTSLSVNCPGPSLTYQWYETTNTSTNYYQYGNAISNSNSSSIQLTPEYSFHYYCKISCSYYPELIFYTDLVFVPTPFAASDRDVLMDIYNNCGGSNWQYNANWGTANDISTWEGVTMTNGRVTGLNLSNKGLTGDLPSGLASLPLTSFNITSNYLTFANI